MSISCDELLSHLNKNAPGFPCSIDDLESLSGPEDFFNALLNNIKKATQRIVISVLYFGTGEREKMLRDAIWDALRRDVEITIFMDEARGTRGSGDGCDSVSFFSELKKDGLRIMQVPSVGKSGMWKYLLRERLNEILAVYHVKGVIFDDLLLMTGANIGDTYLTNRQDRYMLLNVPQLTQHYSDFFSAFHPFCIQPFSTAPSPMKSMADLREVFARFTQPNSRH